MPDGTAAPTVANPITDYVPSARPGGRAPHVWLERGGERLSTIDLVGDGFVLLTTKAGQSWRAAAQRLGLRTFSIGDGELADPEGQWTTAYGLDETGAVLVRPGRLCRLAQPRDDGRSGGKPRRGDDEHHGPGVDAPQPQRFFSRSFFQYSRRFRISRSKPRSTG